MIPNIVARFFIAHGVVATLHHKAETVTCTEIYSAIHACPIFHWSNLTFRFSTI